MNASTATSRSSFAKGLITALLTLTSMTWLATPAQASVISIIGSADVSATSVGSETQVTFDFLNTVTATEPIDGVFDPEIVPFVTLGVINDLTVSSAGLVGGPVSPFLTIGGYVFSVTSLNGALSLTADGSDTALSLTVLGSVTGGDFGASSQAFSGVFLAPFTGESPEQVLDSFLSGTRDIAFSAQLETIESLPEPTSLGLFGTALCIAGVRRFRQQRKRGR